jgi:hypothetical protein
LVFIEANPNSDLTPNTPGRHLCFVGIVETARKRYARGENARQCGA